MPARVSSLAMASSTVKIDLGGIKELKQKVATDPSSAGKNAKFLQKIKRVTSEADFIDMLPEEISAELSEFVLENINAKHNPYFNQLQSISRKQPVYSFMQQNDCSLLLSVLVSSGWYLKFSLSIEDIIKSQYLLHQKQVEAKTKQQDKTGGVPPDPVKLSPPPQYNSYFTQVDANKPGQKKDYKHFKQKKEQNELHTQIVANCLNPKISNDVKVLMNSGQIKGDLRMKNQVYIFN